MEQTIKPITEIEMELLIIIRTVEFRMKALDRKARHFRRPKISGKNRDLIKTKLELKVCKELGMDYGVFCDKKEF